VARVRWLFCAALGLAAAPAPSQPPPEPPGARVALTDGRLFVPQAFVPAGPVPLTLHLHGAYAAAERNHARAKQPGVLVTVVLPGLSAVYRDRFRSPTAFWRILGEARAELRRRFGEDAEVGAVTVTSFSAGFGGVRELLRDPAIFERLETLVMGDSLYAGFTGDPTRREVNPDDMRGFLAFAREAAAGRRRFVLTHTQLHTPTYASTVDTANYLLTELGLVRSPTREPWPGGLTLTGRARRGGFELLTFTGETGPEHMQHLHQLWSFLSRARGLTPEGR
jgi:hypothetical protein